MKTLTSSNFESEINKDNWIVMFWAAWCGPCINTEYLQEFEDQTSGILVGKVNVEENADLRLKYEITVVPTYIIFKNGKPAKTIIGIKDKEALQKIMKH